MAVNRRGERRRRAGVLRVELRTQVLAQAVESHVRRLQPVDVVFEIGAVGLGNVVEFHVQFEARLGTLR